jgi:hypothetical protein
LRIDAAIAAIRERDGRPPMAPWRVHDLRRTAATLMEGACGVAENIKKVYQRASLEPQKAAALATLAATVSRIVHPAAAPLAA